MALLYFLRGILIPLVLAIVLAILVDAVVRMIATRAPRAPRWGVVLLTTLVVIGSVAASFYIIAQGAARIVADGPDLIKRLDETVQVLGQSLHLKRPLNLATLTGDVDVPHVAGSVLGNLQSLTSALLLIIPYFGFILAGRSRIARHFYSLSNWSDNGKSVKAALDHIAEDVETYVWVQTVTGVMIAGAAAAVM